jgi:hypothetical protein
MTPAEISLLTTALATLITSVAGLIRSCQSYKLLKQNEARRLEQGQQK